MLLDPRRLRGPTLSAVDAFFLAYQEHACIPMSLDVEIRLAGPLCRDHLLRAVAALRRRWPSAGCLVEVASVGLRWGAEVPLSQALLEETSPEEIERTRRSALDPFREAPFQVHWHNEGSEHRLLLRAHHALFDGEGFLLAALHFLDALASALVERPVPPAEDHLPAERPRRGATLRSSGPSRGAQRAEPITYLPLQSQEPGPCSVHRELLSSATQASLQERAQRSGVGLPWWCMAAWLRTLSAWCAESTAKAPGALTLEVPMSLRAAQKDPTSVGNHIVPLFLQGDGTLPIEQLAASLKGSFKGIVERREHELEAALTAPGKYLPWPLFRRLAVASNRTGNATSHAVFLRLRHPPEERLATLSRGQLRLLSWTPSTPVCLRMGAALTILHTPRELALVLTFRRLAIPAERAEKLVQTCARELGADFEEVRAASPPNPLSVFADEGEEQGRGER